VDGILPSVGTGLQEEGDVAGGDDLGGHADDETNHTHAYGTDNVPELLFDVSQMYKIHVATVDMNSPSPGTYQSCRQRRQRRYRRTPMGVRS
jgi:hypothetical protein